MCHEHHGRHGHERGPFCPPGGRVLGFVQPWLLLLLSRKSAHGYELMDRLGREENTPADPALLYRTMRQFEEEGLVRSTWDTEGAGPARRIYEITAEGLDYLHAWSVNIQRLRDRLDGFLAEYRQQFPLEGQERR